VRAGAMWREGLVRKDEVSNVRQMSKDVVPTRHMHTHTHTHTYIPDSHENMQLLLLPA
jgi:hypothetical protein